MGTEDIKSGEPFLPREAEQLIGAVALPPRHQLIKQKELEAEEDSIQPLKNCYRPQRKQQQQQAGNAQRLPRNRPPHPCSQRRGRGLAQCFGYIGSSLWIIVSSLAAVFVLMHYYPYLSTLFFRRASCTIYDAVYTTQFACDCGRRCRAAYPCLVIYAYLNGSGLDAEDREWPVHLYIDDWQYADVRYTESDFKEPCHFKLCHPNTDKNRFEVEIFKSRHAQIGTLLQCFYDPGNVSKGAFQLRTISWTLAFHVIFWPGLALFLGMAICAYVAVAKKKSKNTYYFGTPPIKRRRVEFDLKSVCYM